MESTTKSFVSQWDTDAVAAWLRESKLGAFEKIFRENEIDGSVLLKLSESMIVRLFPTIKLEVQFIDLLQALRQRHAAEVNSQKTRPTPSSYLINGRPAPPHRVPGHSIPSSSFDRSSNSNSNSPPNMNNDHHHHHHHHPSKSIHSERSEIQKESTLPLRALKNEPRDFLNHAQANGNLNMDSNENDTRHTFPHAYKLPQFPETLRLALASQDASAFKLRTYYRNLLISSIYDDLTRSYNLWYPNARQYKTVANALVKNYPFLESSTEGGEAAWIDGIKGKFKRGRRSVTSHIDAANALRAENGGDRSSGDEEICEERLVAQTSNGQKRPRHEFEVDSNDGHYETGEISMNSHAKDYDQRSDYLDDLDEEEINRLRICITAMQRTLAATNDPDISLISDFFKETFEIRRNFVKTHNTNEILEEYPALRLHSCLLADFHMQTNIPIQTVLIHKIRAISKPLIRLAKETGCAPEILHTYHAILAQRPQLEQILADTFAVLIVASYFGEYQYLLISHDNDTQSPWPIIRGDFPARVFYDGKPSSVAYNIELDYVQLFHRPLNDFLTAICTLFATYTVFEITYGKLEMTLSFIDCLLRDNAHGSTRSPQVHELITELTSMR